MLKFACRPAPWGGQFLPLFERMVRSFQFKLQAPDGAPDWCVLEQLPEQDPSQVRLLMKPAFEYGECFAVRDGRVPNRYFVGFVVTDSTYGCVMGLMLYFDMSTGRVGAQKVCNCVLARSEMRVDHRNTWLVDQTLVFGFRHQATSRLVLTVNLLSYEDTVIAQDETRELDILLRARPERLDRDATGRFLHVRNQEDEQVLLDLGTLDSAEQEMRYHILPPDAPLETVEPVAVRFGDGYPLTCARCQQETASASFVEGYGSMFLGLSYCPDCGIRFSRTDRQWLCCRVVRRSGVTICHAKLEGNEECAQTHLPSRCDFRGKAVKWPFRRRVLIQPDKDFAHAYPSAGSITTT